jgi:hypothetical protein
LTVDTPPPDVKKFELVRLSVGVPSVGFLCSKSCRLTAPEAAMSAAVSTCSGVDDSALGEARREPVTTDKQQADGAGQNCFTNH